jgi:hypothetical protein
MNFMAMTSECGRGLSRYRSQPVFYGEEPGQHPKTGSGGWFASAKIKGLHAGGV